MSFAPGDFVRLKGLRGPRMMVIAVVSANPAAPHAPLVNVAWFDRLDNLQERQMQEAWLEAWPLPASDVSSRIVTAFSSIGIPQELGSVYRDPDSETPDAGT